MTPPPLPEASPADLGVSSRTVTPETWLSRLRSNWRKGVRGLRFTREGKAFVALTCGVGIGAINTGNNLLYLILAAMLALIVLSGVLAELSLRSLAVWRRTPHRIHAGEETYIALGVRNLKTVLPSFSLAIREHFGKRRDLDAVHFVHLGPEESLLSGYRCVFPRRGRCRFRGWTIETTFPFGLFVKSKSQEGSESAIVYPRTDLDVPIPPLRGSLGGVDGASRRGVGDEVYSLRDYRNGDDRRRIAWKASARRRTLVTREYARGAVATVDVFVANVGGSKRRDPSFEGLLDYAASLVVRLLPIGYEVSLTTLDAQVPPGSGPAHEELLLRTLALLKQHREDDTGELVPLAPPVGATRLSLETARNSRFRPDNAVVVEVDDALVDDLRPPAPETSAVPQIELAA